MLSSVDHELTAAWLQAQPAIVAYVRGLVGDPQLADDLVQEVAVQVVRDWARFDRGRSFVAWAIGIARHRLQDHWRRDQRRPPLVRDPDLLADLASAADEHADRLAARREALRACLESLPARSWAIVERTYVLGESAERVARASGASVAAVWQILSRARDALRRCVERRLDGAAP